MAKAKTAPTPQTEAAKLLTTITELQITIAIARSKAGLDDLEARLDEAKSSLTALMAANGLEQVEGAKHHATLIRQNYSSAFLATKDDIPTDRDELLSIGAISEDGSVRKLVSLRTIIRKKYGPFKKGSKSSEIWKRITKPVVLPDAVEEVVAEGLLSIKEITPAFIEKQKKPYVRIFEDQ
jgi:hypothetical protein